MSSPQANLTPDGPRDPSQRRAVPRLSLRGIEKSFDTNVVLSGIDLDVYEGELVALLGENGAGKSTMSSIVAGLFPPSKGTMTWEGQPYAPARPGEAIYISHRLGEIARIANRIVVLRDGRLVATHDSAKVPVNVLLENMVGRNVDRIFPKIEEPTGKEVLRVEGLTGANGAFQDVSFSVRAGEILGIAGIVGAGRTELVRGIAGVDPLASGSVLIEGQNVQLKAPEDAIKAGVVLVPEDRKAQGVVLDHSVATNLALGNFDRLAPNGWLMPAKVASFAIDAIKILGVKGQANQLMRFLSGGNQQKAIIARWISRSPKIFILDEPTRGIDMGARAEIYHTIASLAQEGMAVIAVSSDLEEVIGLSHRVIVLARGRLQGTLKHGDATNVAIMELATR